MSASSSGTPRGHQRAERDHQDQQRDRQRQRLGASGSPPRSGRSSALSALASPNCSIRTAPGARPARPTAPRASRRRARRPDHRRRASRSVTSAERPSVEICPRAGSSGELDLGARAASREPRDSTSATAALNAGSSAVIAVLWTRTLSSVRRRGSRRRRALLGRGRTRRSRRPRRRCLACRPRRRPRRRGRRTRASRRSRSCGGRRSSGRRGRRCLSGCMVAPLTGLIDDRPSLLNAEAALQCGWQASCRCGTPHPRVRLAVCQQRPRCGTIAPWPQTVLIVDDHAGLPRQRAALLEAEGYEVVGEAADGDDAIAGAARAAPRPRPARRRSCPTSTASRSPRRSPRTTPARPSS